MALEPDGHCLLLVHHRRLGRWMLPGGHVEPDDETIAGAARREVIDEAGAIMTPAFTIAGADVHGIPGGRGEPYHPHHDVLFAFQATSDEIRASEESHAVVWCSSAEFDRHKLPGNMPQACRRSFT